MTRLAATMLLSACTALGACPDAPPHEADGGGGDVGETDAGPGDAGVEDCERELPPFDAGTSEAIMQDDCFPLIEPHDDLFTDAGEPIYEHCYFDAKRDPCCGAAECADTEAEIIFLDAVLAVAEARGYPPSMQLISIGVGDDHAGAEFLVTIDWLEMRLGVSVAADEDGVIADSAIADEMPLWIPTSMPPIADLWAAVRTCDEDAVPYLCSVSDPTVSFNRVGECGFGLLFLWDADVVGSGMSEPKCYPSDRPCCSWTEFP